MRRRFGLFAVLLALFMFCVPSAAAARIEVERQASLTLEHRCDGAPLNGAAFRLYRAADISDAARFTLSGDFSGYPVELSGLDAAGWKAAASTLAVYAAADRLEPLKTGVTDPAGRLPFGDLNTGLYLVVGDGLAVGNTLYSAAPFLVSLPGAADGGAWDYAVTARTKVTADTPPLPGDGELSVVKIWNDDGNRDMRPESIRVSLLRDGEAYDTVTLTADNFWRHSWDGLSNEYRWSVVEDTVPAGYTVAYTGDQTILTITNSYPGGPPKEPPPKLPQTGLLQWPAPVLAVLGVLLFGWGWASFMRGKKHEK